MNKFISKIPETLHQILVVVLVFTWIFTGWPPISIPQKDSSGTWQLQQTRVANLVRVANADTGGPNVPGAAVGAGVTGCTDNTAWTVSVAGLGANDTTYTTITGGNWDSGNQSDELQMSTFGFSLVGSVTSIDGFQVEILGWTPTGTPAASYLTVSLFTAPGSNRGDNKATGTFPTADPGSTYQTFGTTSDDWYPAGGWTQAEVEDPGFGVALCLTAGEANANLNLDHVRITITYTVSVATSTYTQNDFEWFVDNGSEDPTDIWPSGGVDLAENAVLVSLPANQAVASGSEVRIRSNITVATANLGVGGQAFKIQYKATTDCTVLTGYSDVGASTSATIWRFGNGPADQTNLTTAKISTTTSAKQQSYVESNPTETNPVAVNTGETMEWDFNVQHNGASPNTTYCFKIVKSDGTDLDSYNSDSFPKIDTAPNGTQIMRHGNFFLNELEEGFFWAD